MAKSKRTKVKCSECNKGAEIFTDSIAKEGDTVWECPNCHATNTRPEK